MWIAKLDRKIAKLVELALEVGDVPEIAAKLKALKAEREKLRQTQDVARAGWPPKIFAGSSRRSCGV